MTFLINFILKELEIGYYSTILQDNGIVHKTNIIHRYHIITKLYLNVAQNLQIILRNIYCYLIQFYVNSPNIIVNYVSNKFGRSKLISILKSFYARPTRFFNFNAAATKSSTSFDEQLIQNARETVLLSETCL